MKPTWLWTPVILGLLAAGSYGGYLYLRPAVLPPGLLYGNGHIEGTEVTVSAEVMGRVVEVPIVEGERVDQGAVLARVDDADTRTALAQAEATRAAVAQERIRLAKELTTAQHHAATAEQDVARYRELLTRGTVAPQRLEQAANVAAEARGRMSALEAAVAEAASRLEAAGQQMNLLRLQLDKAVIRAPIAGTVLVKAAGPGELAVAGRGIAVLVDLALLELKVFVPERDIGKVRLGAPARVRVDAFPDRTFAARVARIDQQAQFTPRDIHMPEERVRLVFGVTLVLANPDSVLKPGMPADAWILADPEAAWPERLMVPG